MTDQRMRLCVAGVLALVGGTHCGSDTPKAATMGTGGFSGSAGLPTSGAPGNGGATMSAGGSVTSNGGALGAGGSTPSGGTSSNGGSITSGGSSGAGNGGAAGSGGASGAAGMGGNGASGGASGAAGAGGSAPACTGKPGSKRGKTNQTVMAAGASRTFIYYAPMGLDPNTPVPLVIVPHGSTMSGAMMYDITQYSTIADREKFVAVFPDGEGGAGSLAPWNVGTGTCGLGAIVAGAGNDQAFVDEIIKFADADQCIDHNHLFMTGFSMGGYFSHESGCLRSSIKAIGPHSGGTHDLTMCPEKHKPVIMFHFKSDSLINYMCAQDARDKWVAHNGCMASGADVQMVKGGSCEYYKGCPADGQVALCSFDEPSGGDGESPMGHAWSGGNKSGAGAFAAISKTESATELGWAFFKKYAW